MLGPSKRKDDFGSSPQVVASDLSKAIALINSLVPEEKSALANLLKVDLNLVLSNPDIAKLPIATFLQHLEAGADCAIEDGHVTKLSLPGQGLRFCQNFDPNPKYSRELSPADLSEFKNLREVTLWGGTIQKYDPLLEFTKLQKVLVSGLNNHQLGVLAKLKQKGVEVVLR